MRVGGKMGTRVAPRCPVQQGVKGRGPGAGMAVPVPPRLQQNSTESENSKLSSGLLRCEGMFAEVEGILFYSSLAWFVHVNSKTPGK